MSLIPRNRRVILMNRPFSGGPGLKVYAGVGSPAAILYRSNRIFDGRHPAINPVLVNDVSVATVNSPSTTVSFTAPVAWYGQTVYLQVRTFANDRENETISGVRRMDLDGSGNLVTTFAGSGLILGVDRGFGNSATVRFTWQPDRDSAAVLTFAAVRLTGPSSPADTVQTALSGRRQSLTISGLSVGTYTFRIEARRTGSTSVTIGTATVVISAAPSTTGSLAVTEA